MKVHFETGKPVTFRYFHNKEKSPNFGSQYGQDIEPAGRYVIHDETEDDYLLKKFPDRYDAGSITFKNPLVIDIKEPLDHKKILFNKYKKKGAALSRAIVKDGYDGIVSRYPDGSTGEIIDLHKFTTSEGNMTKAKKLLSMIRESKDSLIEYMALILFIDSFASYAEEADDSGEFKDDEIIKEINSDIHGELTNTVPALFKDVGLNIKTYLDVDAAKKFAAAVEKLWGKELFDSYLKEFGEDGAYQLVMLGAGHGISPFDEYEDWFEKNGVNTSYGKDRRTNLPSIEGPYAEADEAYTNVYAKYENNKD